MLINMTRDIRVALLLLVHAIIVLTCDQVAWEDRTYLEPEDACLCRRNRCSKTSGTKDIMECDMITFDKDHCPICFDQSMSKERAESVDANERKCGLGDEERVCPQGKVCVSSSKHKAGVCLLWTKSLAKSCRVLKCAVDNRRIIEARALARFCHWKEDKKGEVTLNRKRISRDISEEDSEESRSKEESEENKRREKDVKRGRKKKQKKCEVHSMVQSNGNCLADGMKCSRHPCCKRNRVGYECGDSNNVIGVSDLSYSQLEELSHLGDNINKKIQENVNDIMSNVFG